MIRRLLERLEQNPSGRFTEHELQEYDLSAFERYRRERLLQATPPPEFPSTFLVSGKRLLVTERDGRLEGIDEDEPDADVISVDSSDIRRWRVDVKRLCAALHTVNGLDGSVSPIDDRFWYLGQAPREGRPSAVVLGLISAPMAMTELRGVRGRLPERSNHLVVVCPRYRPTPAESLELAALSISVTGIEDDGRIEWPEAQETLTIVPSVVLTNDEEVEFLAGEFRCRYSIRLTGARHTRAGNIVNIDGRDIVITDVPFRLLVRLVVALFETPEGYVVRGTLRSGGGLADEGFYRSEGMEQAWDRLRKPLRPDCDRLIETKGRTCTVVHAPALRIVGCGAAGQTSR